jgi:hypothetical protein
VPAGQETTLQTPPWHEALEAQVWPQLPQLSESRNRFVHEPKQLVRPAAQQIPLWQVNPLAQAQLPPHPSPPQLPAAHDGQHDAHWPSAAHIDVPDGQTHVPVLPSQT